MTELPALRDAAGALEFKAQEGAQEGAVEAIRVAVSCVQWNAQDKFFGRLSSHLILRNQPSMMQKTGYGPFLSIALGTRPLLCGVGRIGRLGAMTLVTSCHFSGVPRCQAGVGAGRGRPKWGGSTASTERRFSV